MEYRPGAELDYEVKVTFLISFTDIKGLDGIPATSTISYLLHKVGEIIEALEQEARKTVATRS